MLVMTTVVVIILYYHHDSSSTAFFLSQVCRSRKSTLADSSAPLGLNSPVAVLLHKDKGYYVVALAAIAGIMIEGVWGQGLRVWF